MSEKHTVTRGLKKVLGLQSLFIISIGLVVSQASVVSVLQGAGLGGGTFFIAILIAFILTLCYISTYSELALMMPKKYPGHKRPFKSPMFPLLQIIGIAGMVFAFINNAPTPQLRLKVYVNAALFIGISAVFAFFWVKYKMKKGLFESEGIEQAIKD
ncbi:MAG: hypothetical protein ABI760_18790 [Ferruginibacter sp.]